MANRRILKVAVDCALLAVIIVLMAYPVTEQWLHEWIGIALTALIIMHHVLDRKWYKSIGKGKYSARRALQTGIDLALIPVAILMILAGIFMSDDAVPFLRVAPLVGWARTTHLCVSAWFMVLVGLHLGNHMSSVIRDKDIGWQCVYAAIAAYGLYEFIRADMFGRMFLTTEFAMLAFGAPVVLALLRTVCEIWFWMWIAMWLVRFLTPRTAKKKPQAASR